MLHIGSDKNDTVEVGRKRQPCDCQAETRLRCREMLVFQLEEIYAYRSSDTFFAMGKGKCVERERWHVRAAVCHQPDLTLLSRSLTDRRIDPAAN